MSTNRWDPWRDIVSLREAMNSLLEESFVRPRPGFAPASGGVALDVKETDDQFLVIVPLPGVRPEDVEISVLGDSLRLSGEFKDRFNDDGRWLVRERRLGRFERSINLPAPVSADRAGAEFDGGLLVIRLPKAEEARPKTIPVKGKDTE